MATLDMAGIITRVCTDLKEKFASKSVETSKQDALVSGTNIKTVNGESILGSGDLVVSGGGGSTLTLYTNYNCSNLYVDSALATSLLESVDYDYDAAMSMLKNAGKVIVEWPNATNSEARYAVVCGAYYDTTEETFDVALIKVTSVVSLIKIGLT